ncbi:hypothetical protein RRG08_008182 [Elysia crispata]|uniref:Uncharacterized protein n=1 Tax=Elysia crispata TaxID=231223 RepID=A0AAE1A8A1_9GAST|nr:hypothetical protein RRG08_008182 [Elysia crispata]
MLKAILVYQPPSLNSEMGLEMLNDLEGHSYPNVLLNCPTMLSFGAHLDSPRVVTLECSIFATVTANSESL